MIIKVNEGIRTEVVLKFFIICGIHRIDIKNPKTRGMKIIWNIKIVPNTIIKSSIKVKLHNFTLCLNNAIRNSPGVYSISGFPNTNKELHLQYIGIKE